MANTLIAADISGLGAGYYQPASLGSLSPTSILGFNVQFFVSGYPTAGETTLAVDGNAVSAFTGSSLIVGSTSYPLARAPAFDGSATTQIDFTGLAFVAGQTYTVNIGGAAPDTTPPSFTSATTTSVAENAVLAFPITTNEATTITIQGGADAARFEMSGSTLRWLSNGTKDFEAPNDADLNNVYVVTVRATDAAGNFADQTISVTVTDVAEYDGPVWRASAALSNGTSSVTPALPTRSLNDTLVLSIVTPAQSVTVPSPWVQVSNSPQTTGAAAGLTSISLYVYTRTADGTETAPTITGGPDHILAQITSLSECEVNVSAGSVNATASTTHSFPTPTTTKTNNLQFAIGAVSTDIATARASAWTNSFTERFDGATTTGNGGGLFGATKQVITAGPIGATQTTLATSSTQASMMIAFVKKTPSTAKPCSYVVILT